ncbi:predicted protein [Aspergillus terreus NIH2624]|uniref:Nucleoside phosphorylase domain-containing protein n=1 Tax=Aspergillus terreus (strain NIH 2624 / FGSC A1156) TaxID=341663 RepID=Q0CTQ5_ASPTN|nr:uncharacterized protein ATEG_02929 [Aspergillus terreus NIH2624]EAU36203.1 predicted protein [Aspergillus terreus NIH2624]
MAAQITSQVGWICSRPIEYAAARAMLDESYGHPEQQHAADSNTYHLGRMGKHYIVITCMPSSQRGTAAVAAAVHHLFQSYYRIRMAMLVGVGGGIPSQWNDIRLGDIVVSYPDGNCGGVRHFSVGSGGQIRCFGGPLNIPPRTMLSAVDMMKGLALTKDPRYLEVIRTTTQGTGRVQRTFARPAHDSLFKIEHEHPTYARDCTGCPAEWEVQRAERRGPTPKAHYGIIASGDVIMDSGQLREALRQKTGALCVDMEAAGLLQGFPGVVIRGISNYADSHQNDQWEAFAALAAASYAKDLLSYMPSERPIAGS